MVVDDMVGVIHIVDIMQNELATKPIVVEQKLVIVMYRLVDIVVRVVKMLTFMLFWPILKLKLLMF